MLTHLHINNFAVVRSLDIELNRGLTAITGETGAGKSIMVDALGLVLGDRADNSVIRDNTERAEITASFDIGSDPDARQWLDCRDMDSQDCIIRRVLKRDGASRAYINGMPVTLQQLKELGELLIDIHSQHEHQSLLQRDNHRKLLDAFASTSEQAASVQDHYRNWQSADRELQALKHQLEEQSQQRELLGYQLQELSALNIQANEFSELEQEQSRLSNAEQILMQGREILQLCSGSSDNGASAGGLELIAQANRVAEQIQDEHEALRESTELLSNAAIQMEEAVASLNHYLDSVELNPERLRQVEDRLGELYDMARKHRVQPEELLPTLDRLTREYQQYDDLEDQIAALQQKACDCETGFNDQAVKLSQRRRAAAGDFDRQIQACLQQLGMEGSSFDTRFTELEAGKYGPQGLEDIEFLVSTNAGMQSRPLHKIVSGGELSRISLAIQVISAQNTRIRTLVFDEVDVGIGGATAEVVGRLLRQIGHSGQAICVTHQPQVAAKAHHHLSVSKTRETGEADSKIKQLADEDKIGEIARMLGGIELTEQTLAHAEEMLASASAG